MTSHIDSDRMQRFLAGEADLPERDVVTIHLAGCSDCTARLAALAAEEDGLRSALLLDPDEAAWAESLDLTGPVMQNLRPWYRDAGTLLTLALVALPTLWATALAGRLIGGELGPEREQPVGFLIDLFQEVLPALWRFLVYLSRGGLLATIWPVLLLVLAYGFWRLHRAKEVHPDA